MRILWNSALKKLKSEFAVPFLLACKKYLLFFAWRANTKEMVIISGFPNLFILNFQANIPKQLILSISLLRERYKERRFFFNSGQDHIKKEDHVSDQISCLCAFHVYRSCCCPYAIHFWCLSGYYLLYKPLVSQTYI